VIHQLLIIDEIKWQLRLPSRFAMRQLKLTYLDKVESETAKFLNENIKHNFLAPGQPLSLDMTLKEAEILHSANPNVRQQAESGQLAATHKKFNDLEKRIEGDYLAVRNHIGKILIQIEEKEDALVD
jgi:hypothetical protein